MKNKRKLIILGLILFALIGIYIGKNYIEGIKQINFQSINVVENLEEAKEGIPTIIMFKTDTCPYCVEMQKELSYVSKEREGKFNIYYARLEEEYRFSI